MRGNEKRLLLLLTILSNLVYIIWRIFFTIPKGEGVFSLICAIILLIVEIMGMIEMFVHYRGMSVIEYPEKPKIDEDLYPDIDVFIATYNEPIDLIKKTVNGCKNMEYPDLDKVHIYICDDGNREEMRILAEKMGVNYITREDRSGAKAGNLNNAMANSSSPLIATFDADMIPMHDFLMEMVPYFLKNEQAKKDGINKKFDKVGFVQSPQSFYNPDLFQFNLYSENRIPNEQDYFYRDVQVSRNKSNSVIYGGSNTVISREALNEVGGFYTNSITEDFATGILIQSKGYRCYAIPDVHASGLSPTDLKSLIKQRERWARGCIQTARRLNILFRKGLNFEQKISYLTSITYWYSSLKRFVIIMAPILFAVFNVIIVDCTLLEVLIFWLPMYILSNTTLKILSKNIRTIRWTNIYETILFQPLMLSIILETFAISKNKFSVTKKDKIEDDFKYRFWQLVPYYLYLGLSIIGILKIIVLTFKENSVGYFVPLFWIIGNLFSIIMAILFISGRKQIRKTERVLAKVDCKISQNNYHIETKTVDISEEGFAFILDKPEYISEDKNFNVIFNEKIGNKKYKAKAKAKIVNVIEVDSRWKYSANITELDEEDKSQWIQIVHDRVPTLPQNISKSIGLFEDLQINFFKRLKKPMSLSRKAPRIDLEYNFYLDYIGKVKMKNFNYKYVLLKFKENGVSPKKLFIHIRENIEFECILCEGRDDYRGVLYNVVNIDEILTNIDNRKKINDWLSTNKYSLENKDIVSEAVDNFEFEVMDYL